MRVRRHARGGLAVAVLTVLAMGGAVPAAAQPAEDTEPPVVTVDSAPPAVTRDEVATVAFTGTDPGRPEAALTFTCSLDTGWPGPPCTSPWTSGTLAEGDHVLRITPKDEAGNAGETAYVRWRVDRSPPAVWWTHARGYPIAPSAEVRWGGDDHGSGIGSYDVRYRVARFDGTFGAYRYRDSAQGTTATSFAMALRRGYTYCVSVRARDTLGNLGTWQGSQCMAAPLDDAVLTPSAGWTRHTSASFYGGTYTFARTPGRTLTLGSMQGRGIGIVARTCPGCGRLRVLVNGVHVGEISTNAARTTYRKTWGVVWSYLRSGTVTLMTVDDKPVYVDGLAVMRA